MKKTLLLVVTLFLFFIYAQPASAQLKKGSWLWTLNVGYAPLTSTLTNNSIDGWSGSTTVEKLVGKSNWSIGMNFAYFNASDNDARIDAVEMNQSYSSYSIYLGTKYFVTGMDKWVPYFGLSLGVNQNSRYTTISGTNTTTLNSDVVSGTEHKSSYAFAAPIGVYWFVSDEVYLGFNLTSIWNDDTYFTSAVNLLMNLSVGFQIN